MALKLPKPHNLSFASFPLTLSFKGITVSSATGFYYYFENKVFLITNWHVVTGRHPLTMECLSEKLIIPDVLGFPCQKESASKDKSIMIAEILDKEEVTAKLYADQGCDAPEQALWLEHPKDKVDVVAIPLPLSESRKRILMEIAANQFNSIPDLAFGVASSVLYSVIL